MENNQQLQVTEKTQELSLLKSKPLAYYAAIKPRQISDCFAEQYNNLPSLCEEVGRAQIKALLATGILQFMAFKGQQPFSDDIADMLIEQIIEDCWYLNLADFKLCLNKHLGDKVYGTLSAGDILGMFQAYKEERCNTADDMSYAEHLQTKGEGRYNAVPMIENLSNKLKLTR